MRHLITFVVRLWLDVQTPASTWEGQVECVANSDQLLTHTPEELLAFIATHTVATPELPGAVPETHERVAERCQE
ncbi:MAG: hypothetical protein RBT75_08890 [Anaerolineae bacterium]|jgi:hypothetical protein|nr:hypothetical protein [Anaerolineae bacterium]